MTKTDQIRLTRWRLKMLGHASASPRSVARTCRHFGISRQTFVPHVHTRHTPRSCIALLSAVTRSPYGRAQPVVDRSGP